MGRLAICLAVAAFAISTAPPSGAQDFERGAVIGRVVCRADPGQSYALYLPSSFDPSRTWPVLVLFDPGARGPLAVRAFRDAAETYGWILAASNVSRNGPMEASLRAAGAVWADVGERFPIDPRRIYAGGFSGGARVASAFSAGAGRKFAGVIGCGAGLARGISPATLGAEAYFGLIGFGDFNYGEMKALDLSLDPAGIAHRIFFFEGTHDWPPPGATARALGWFEVETMKRGSRPKDPDIAAAVVGRELDEAAAFEAAGRVFWAIERLEAARSLAAGLDLGLPGLADLSARIASLSARREFKAFVDAEKSRDRRSDEFRAGFSGALGAVEDEETGGPLAVPPVLREMEIGFLVKEARTAKAPEDRALASRLLFEFSFAAQARAADLRRKGDLARAGAYLDLALAGCEPGLPREKPLLFDRACVAAAAGDKKAALKFLTSAVDKGFADIDLLEAEKDLDPVRDTPRFKELLDRVKAAAEPRKGPAG